MLIKEISNGSEIKIHATIGGHKIVLMTEAVFGVAAGLLVKPMEYFGRYMQILDPSLVQVRNKRDGRIYNFTSSSITPVKTRYGNFHLIKCVTELEPENSRKAERFYIEKLGVFTVNGNVTQMRNCIIHDISMRGISIILDNTSRCKVGDTLDIRFRYGASLHNYEVSTTVVRFFTVQDKPAAGCTINGMNVDIVTLVNSKKAEKQTLLDEIPETNLNPAISQKQQMKEVEEDLASLLIPAKSNSPKTISYSNPFDPSKLEHISSGDKTLRQQKKEQIESEQAKRIAEMLDLHDF